MLLKLTVLIPAIFALSNCGEKNQQARKDFIAQGSGESDAEMVFLDVSSEITSDDDSAALSLSSKLSLAVWTVKLSCENSTNATDKKVFELEGKKYTLSQLQGLLGVYVKNCTALPVDTIGNSKANSTVTYPIDRTGARPKVTINKDEIHFIVSETYTPSNFNATNFLNSTQPSVNSSLRLTRAEVDNAVVPVTINEDSIKIGASSGSTYADAPDVSDLKISVKPAVKVGEFTYFLSYKCKACSDHEVFLGSSSDVIANKLTGKLFSSVTFPRTTVTKVESGEYTNVSLYSNVNYSQSAAIAFRYPAKTGAAANDNSMLIFKFIMPAAAEPTGGAL